METPVAEETVVEGLQPGYLLHDRLVRSAIVAVAAVDRRSSDHLKTWLLGLLDVRAPT
ncbi:nucleotide exchange factor GrpE [Xanthobacter wiegelii]|uniref:nucleotide exchange factor GrpE n=1 Tax=Xanthobacter wiegelii TaxID=3119913 RepID=UPI003736EB22